MNAQEASRALLADPRRSDATIDEAVASHAGLADLRQALRRNGDALAAAFAEAAPPPGLADRIILHARYRRRTRWMAAAAAGATVAVLLLFTLRPEAPPPIALAMLDHVVTQSDELADDGNVPARQARASLQRIGVRFDDLGYRIRHLSECVVDGRTGRHIVMDTPDGPLTLLILPRRAGEMPGRVELRKADFRAVLRPAGAVAIGVFGNRRLTPETLDGLMRKMILAGAEQA